MVVYAHNKGLLTERDIRLRAPKEGLTIFMMNLIAHENCSQMIDGVFYDSDELKTKLDLQCRDAGIRVTCI